MLAGASVFKQQRVGVPEVEHHDRIRNAGLGHIDPGFGNDYRRIGRNVIFGNRFLEYGIGCFFFALRMRGNREMFPRGVDLILTAGRDLICLPRSCTISLREA